MYENDVDWRYRVRHLTPTPYGQSEAYYFASAHGPGDLGKEHTRSREIGYNGFFRETGLAVDVRLFHEEITGLISDPLSVVDFSPTTAIASASPARKASSTGAWAYATACAPPTPISTTTPPVATTGA